MPDRLGLPDPVTVWGLPLTPLTFGQTLDAVGRLIESGGPGYFVTANLHYAMLSDSDPRLAAVNRDAAFLVADGQPLVAAGRGRLPERVAGADLVPALCGRAAESGRSVFFLGGEPGVGGRAAEVLRGRFPALRVAGVESPPYRPLSPAEHAELVGKIRAAKPDLLFVAFGQPKGELWLHEHLPGLGVSAAVQIGASLDFLAGRSSRAPRWVQRLGLEWAHRVAQEPRRLGGRYARNALFAARMLLSRPKDRAQDGHAVAHERP